MLPSEHSVILLTCIQVIIGLEKFGLFEYIYCIYLDFWNKNAANSEALEGVLGIQGYGPKA